MAEGSSVVCEKRVRVDSSYSDGALKSNEASRSVQAVEEALAPKMKIHNEYLTLSRQLDRAKICLWFWESLHAGLLPQYMSTYEKMHSSGAITHAQQQLDELIRKRKVVVPEGSTPHHQVIRGLNLGLGLCLGQGSGQVGVRVGVRVRLSTRISFRERIRYGQGQGQG